MTAAIEAVRADREALLGICAGLSPAEWQLGSGCEGWSVQDVVSHLGALFWGIVARPGCRTWPGCRPSARRKPGSWPGAG